MMKDTQDATEKDERYMRSMLKVKKGRNKKKIDIT